MPPVIVRVKVTDDKNASIDQVFTVTVNNLNEIPSIGYAGEETSARYRWVKISVISDPLPHLIPMAMCSLIPSSGNRQWKCGVDSVSGELSR